MNFQIEEERQNRKSARESPIDVRISVATVVARRQVRRKSEINGFKKMAGFSCEAETGSRLTRIHAWM
jgi:hypothetical protein